MESLSVAESITGVLVLSAKVASLPLRVNTPSEELSAVCGEVAHAQIVLITLQNLLYQPSCFELCRRTLLSLKHVLCILTISVTLFVEVGSLVRQLSEADLEQQPQDNLKAKGLATRMQKHGRVLSPMLDILQPTNDTDAAHNVTLLQDLLVEESGLNTLLRTGSNISLDQLSQFDLANASLPLPEWFQIDEFKSLASISLGNIKDSKTTAKFPTTNCRTSSSSPLKPVRVLSSQSLPIRSYQAQENQINPKPSAGALKSIRKQLLGLEREPPGFVSATRISEDLFSLTGTINGPVDTPYEGGFIFLSIHLPSEYPIKPPKATFNSRVYHPNINSSGKISIDILGSNWSPSLTIQKVLISICSLLDDPNPDDCLVPEAGRLYRIDRQSYNDKARYWTNQYAV